MQREKEEMTTTKLEENKWIAFVLSMLLGLITWMRRQYVLDKPMRPLRLYKGTSLGLSFLSAGLWWISIVSVERELVLQISAGFVSTILSWYAFTILVNDDVSTVKSKQFVSLSFYILNDTVLQIMTRLILR
jgi:hypothetical protein